MTNEEYINPLDFEENIKVISKSNLFDDNFYLEHNPDIEESERDPLGHWVTSGYEEDRNPNIKFNNIFYKRSYLTGQNWNSLTHFIKIGKSLGYKTNFFENSLTDHDFSKIDRICKHLNKKVSIFLLIFEVSDRLKECINSIIENTELDFELILLSSEKLPKEYHSILNELDNNIIIKENPDDNYLSFIINNINSAENDIVIMNNYSIVTPNWLKKLIIKSYYEDEIDIAYPLSNLNTNIHSPHRVSDNEFSLTKEGINDLSNKFSLNLNVESKYIDASCFFVKNKSIEKFIDKIQNIIFNPKKKIFVIANLTNLKCVIDDTTYINIYEELFSAENKFLPILNKKGALEDEKIKTELPQNIRNNLKHIVIHYDMRKLYNRILFILDEKDYKLYHDFLFKPFLGIYECYFLTTDYDKITLWKNTDKLKVWENDSKKYSITNNSFKKIYFDIINSFKIDLVQLNSLKNNTFDLLEICKLMRIPIVFYDDSQHIKGINAQPGLTQNNISKYINKTQDLFKYADVFLCNDEVKKDYLKILPNLPKEIKILDNSIIYPLKNNFRFYSENNIKVLIPYDIDKNLEERLFKLLDDERFSKFEFHILGKTSDKLKESFHCYNDFSINKLIDIIEEVKPEFLFINQIFNDIFDVLDISFKQKIPCFIKDDEILIDAVDQQTGMVFVDTTSIDCLFESMQTYSNFDNYYNLLKKIYYSDSVFNNEINFFAQNLTETYLKYQKESKLMKNYMEKSEPQIKKEPDFTNFEDFLSNSYLVPVINAPFLEEEKACFATMDNIAENLISKVNESEFKPLVSIIMPVFNREDIALDAINSVLNQTYPNFELIIVDDGSTDNTKELLENLEHEKIRVIYHENNFGSSKARNTGLNESKGDIIMYLDSDNEWNSKYVEAMVGAFIELPDADALYSGQLIYNNSEEPISMRFGAFNKSLLHNANYIDMNCFSHKRHVSDELGGFDENLNRLVDWDFILRISNSFKIYSIPVLLSKYYNTRANNRITSNTLSNLSLFNSNVNYIRKIIEKNKMESKSKGELSRKVSIIIPNFESLSNLRECIKSIQKLNYGEMVRIIVVDNNSNDAVRFYLETLSKNNEIMLIQNNINFGFTYAIKQGIDISDSDSDILLLNNNAILTENAIESLQNATYNIEDCGLVAPQQILPERTPSIRAHVPHATTIFKCDVTPSIKHKNIINVPTFHDGEFLELNFAPFFCLYFKREVVNNYVELDVELERYYRSNKSFSGHIRNMIGLKIYHVSNAIVHNTFKKKQ